MADEPTVTITASELYALVTRVEDAAARVSQDVVTLSSTVDRIEGIAADHEARLRELEKARDNARRLDVLERNDTRHEASLAKQGERIGALEARDASRVSPIALAAVSATFLGIVVAVVLGVINLNVGP